MSLSLYFVVLNFLVQRFTHAFLESLNVSIHVCIHTNNEFALFIANEFWRFDYMYDGTHVEIEWLIDFIWFDLSLQVVIYNTCITSLIIDLLLSCHDG